MLTGLAALFASRYSRPALEEQATDGCPGKDARLLHCFLFGSLEVPPMRSLYWLTAITLVAAAVTTVAIADYGRRHPTSLTAWWNNSNPIQLSETNYGKKQPVISVEKASNAPVYVPGTGYVPQIPPAAELPTTAALELPTPVATAIPAPPPTSVAIRISPPQSPRRPEPIRIEDVPEHQVLREAALKELASLQVDPPALPTSTPKPPVVDEFTFNDKPLEPLYVPIQPEAKVVLPPVNVMKEVAKLPMIPGVTQGTTAAIDKAIPVTSFKNVPAYTPATERGPEVLPGLHAAKPTVPDTADNPVQETMQAIGELISLMNPTTYLFAMPMDKKVTKSTAFAEVKQACNETCDAKQTCPATTVAVKPGEDCCKAASTCPAEGACKADGTCCKTSATTTCKNAICEDEIAVRTYSVAEFTSNTGTNHDDLIRLITTMVAPNTWDTKDSTIEYFPLGKCLVVRHSNKVQDQVEDLLTQLRGQVQKQNKSPIISRMPTVRPEMSFELELVPITPRETSTGLPRVITNESNHCLGDDDFFGMIPMSPCGRLIAVPMTSLSRVESSSLVPAGFAVKPNESATFTEGPVLRSQPKAPEFFPWFLPYAPLPQGPETCEEELLNRVGYVNYTDEEIALLFLMACEREEQ